MKSVPLYLHGVLLGLLSASIQAQDPVLVTPGTATWQNKDIATGTRTEFSLTGNTVLNWERLKLESGSEIDFNFLGGDRVLNMLTGGKTHRIDGTVTSNGNVAFVSPNASLVVDGSITAKSVTLSTLNVDPTDFNNGGDLTFSGGSDRMRNLTVRGSVDATKGDVVIAGGMIQIDTTGVVSAQAGGIIYGAGESVQIDENGIKRVSVEGQGVVAHSGLTSAGQMEIVAGNSVSNAGRFGNANGNSRVFVQVGDDGKITNQARGVIVGHSSFKGALVQDGLVIVWEDADGAQLVAESSLKLPELKSPDGSQSVVAKTFTSSSPMSASSDAARAAKPRTRSVAKVDASKSLLRRSSFFGMRGGGEVVSR